MATMGKGGKAFDLDVIVDIVFDDGLLFLRLRKATDPVHLHNRPKMPSS